MNHWLRHNLSQRNENNKLPFQVKFDFTTFTHKSFREESEKVCLELNEKYGDKLFLSFSGGADSEYIFKLFLELNLPITPVIVSCRYNQFDIKRAFDYCANQNVKPIVLEYGDEFLNIADEKIYSKGFLSPIGMCPLLVYDFVKNDGGIVITGQGEPLPITDQKNRTDIRRNIHFYEFEYYLDVYSNYQQPAPFFCYNQSIFYSYMKEIDTSMDLEEAKCKLYNIPYRRKTYWSREIYDDIKAKSRIKTGSKCEFDSKKLMLEMEKFLK